MDCTTSGIQLMALVDGELPTSEKERVARHVAQCQDCARQVQFWRTIGQWMAEAPVPLPMDLAVRVRRAVAAAPDVPQWDCDRVQPLLDSLAHGELEGLSRAAVEVHCLFCVKCQATYEMMLDQVLLAQHLPPVTVPADLKDRIAAAVAAEQVSVWDRIRERLAPWLQWRPVPVGLAAAAAVSLLWVMVRPHPSMRSVNVPAVSESTTVARSPSLTSPDEREKDSSEVNMSAPEVPGAIAESDVAIASEREPEPPAPEHSRPMRTRIAKAASSMAGRGRTREARPARTRSERTSDATPSDRKPVETTITGPDTSRPASASAGTGDTPGRNESSAPATHPPTSTTGATPGIVPVARTTTEEKPGTKLADVDYRPPVRGFMAPSLAGDTPEPAPSLNTDSGLIAEAEEPKPSGGTSATSAIARNDTTAIPVSPAERSGDPLAGTKRTLRSRATTSFAGPGHFERDESRLVKVEVVRMKF